MLFGLLRFGVLAAAPHPKTTPLIRLAGHLFFGGLGGGLAAGAVMLHDRRRDH